MRRTPWEKAEAERAMAAALRETVPPGRRRWTSYTPPGRLFWTLGPGGKRDAAAYCSWKRRGWVRLLGRMARADRYVFQRWELTPAGVEVVEGGSGV